MNAINNDSILRELKEIIEEKQWSEKSLLDVEVKMKQKVFDIVSKNAELLDSYRYIAHLQNELIQIKKVSIKKKYIYFF